MLTNRGRGVAVIQSLKDYEAQTEEQIFLRGVVQDLTDLEKEREVSLDDIFADRIVTKNKRGLEMVF